MQDASVHQQVCDIAVLVDEEGTVTGVLDFGDVVHTARVVDLAVALSYLRTPLGITDTTPFVEGFESAVRLTPEEHEALPILIAARLVERTLVNLTLARGNPEARDDAQHGADHVRAAARVRRCWRCGGRTGGALHGD